MHELLTRHLVREEGLRLEPYQDHLGWWTVGVGHLIDSRKGGKLPPGIDSFPISREQAYSILQTDIWRLETDLWAKIPYFRGLTEVRQVVLASMAFQMGVSGLLGFKNTLEMVKNGLFQSAATGMLHSLWAEQTPGRASRLSTAMETNSPFTLTGK